MINDKRVVPIYRTDYLSMIATVLSLIDRSQGLTYPSYQPLEADTIAGDFRVGKRPGKQGRGYIARQPARTVEFDKLDSSPLLFCAAYDFKGITCLGEPAEYAEGSARVVPDGITLHEASIENDQIVIKIFSPQVGV